MAAIYRLLAASKKIEVQSLICQSFRVSHATYSRSGGATVEEVQQQLGHSRQQTTNGYIQEDDDSVKQRLVAEHRALPLAGGSKVKALLKHIEKLYAELDEGERRIFTQGIEKITE